MLLHLLQCFGSNAQSGNKALVVEKDNFTPTERLFFAQQHNFPACVFMKRINDFTLSLDYYYPHTQSPLCLHGTLAAGYIYFANKPGINNLIVVTKQQQKMIVEKINSTIFISVEEKRVPTIPLNKALILQLLNLNDANDLLGFTLISVGSTKLLIEMKSKDSLNALQPNLLLINDWSKTNKISGCYAYVRQNTHIIYGRNFNHLNPRLEDSATGVAAAALTIYYKKGLSIKQGQNLGNSCLIKTKYILGKAFIGGKVQKLAF